MKLITNRRSRPLTVCLDDYEKIPIDRIFDVLEKILDAKADNNTLIHFTFTFGQYLKAIENCEKEIKQGESLWESLRDDYDAKYYIEKAFASEFNDFHSISEVAKSVFKIKPVTLTKEWVETNYVMREYKAKKETFPAEEYLIPATMWAYYKPEMSISEHDDCKAYAEQQNKKYRIMKCKNCGGYEIVSRDYDEKLLSRGLQPVQRCSECRHNRKERNDSSTHQTKRT